MCIRWVKFLNLGKYDLTFISQQAQTANLKIKKLKALKYFLSAFHIIKIFTYIRWVRIKQTIRHQEVQTSMRMLPRAMSHKL
jgi:hypothetical protein